MSDDAVCLYFYEQGLKSFLSSIAFGSLLILKGMEELSENNY